MKKLKLILPFIALLCALGLYHIQANTGNWSSQADISWFDPTYTTFTIDTPAKLAGVAKLVNDNALINGNSVDGINGKIMEIDRDLDLSAFLWTPIGTEATPFKGTLIAKGETIFRLSGLKIKTPFQDAGLIGYMKDGTVGGFELAANGEINFQAVNQTLSVGAAVGRMTDNSIVYSINNYIAINVSTTEKAVYVGGIVGQGEGLIATANQYGKLTARGALTYNGGIVGFGSAKGLKIKKVANEGEIIASSQVTKDVYAGGIVATNSSKLNMDEENTVISNKGAITVTESGKAYEGGIVTGKQIGRAHV